MYVRRYDTCYPSATLTRVTRFVHYQMGYDPLEKVGLSCFHTSCYSCSNPPTPQKGTVGGGRLWSRW